MWNHLVHAMEKKRFKNHYSLKRKTAEQSRSYTVTFILDSQFDTHAVGNPHIND